MSRSGEPENWGRGQRQRRGGIERKEEGEEERGKEKGGNHNNHHSKQKQGRMRGRKEESGRKGRAGHSCYAKLQCDLVCPRPLARASPLPVTLKALLLQLCL